MLVCDGEFAFYFMYPVYGSLLDGMSIATIGTFGLTDTMTSLGWGAYFLVWGLVGFALPLYLIVKGASKE